ncbi:MAG: cryptochrome/photolyase family protein, partial [Aquiluna sp.]
MLLPEVLSQFKKRPYHRQKAHLILYAIRSRAMDPRVELVSLENYRELGDYKELSVAVKPTTRPMVALAESLVRQQMPNRGFCNSEDEWRQYATGKKLKLEDFYRQSRRRLGVLMDGDSPVGGAWNFDAENRLPPPKEPLAVEPAWTPVEDELDDAVRQTLDELERGGVKFIGVDGPRRFAATEVEARSALEHFIENRLDLFGPYEDAMDERDWTLSHSLLSVPMNLGLLDPVEVVRLAEQAYTDGKARLSSVEGFIRQILGWRDYVYHLYWHFDEDYTAANHLDADSPLPEWMRELDPDAIQAKCLSDAISS